MADQFQTLSQLLVERGLLTPEQASELAARAASTGTALPDLIRDENIIAPEAFAQAISAATGLPFVDLAQTGIKDNAMANVSRKAAATYRFVAFGQEGNFLLVALENPL